jgi:hypothetical protein
LFATFTVGKVFLKGAFILIKMTTTVKIVTPCCFGGRHDDSKIVNDEREGLVMDGKERARIKKERGEERGKGKNMSDAFRGGAVSTRSPTVQRNK